MAITLNQTMQSEGAAVYYSQAFRNVLESHMAVLRVLPTNQVMEVDPHDTYKYEADLDGFLLSRNIGAELHWVVMRVNNLTTTTEFGEQHTQLIIPAIEAINTILRLHQTVSSKIN